MPKIKKGRQGRCQAVRDQKDADRERRKRENQRVPFESFWDCYCRHCFYPLNSVIEDYHLAELVCGHCGAVVNVNASVPSFTQFQIPVSKPYERVIHYQQRIAQATCRDPLLPNSVILKIEDYVWLHWMELDPPEIWGPKTFKKICNACKLSPRTSRQWIQIRQRLNNGAVDRYREEAEEEEEGDESESDGETTIVQLSCPFDTIPWEVILGYDMARRMKIRYRLISVAFDEVILNHPDPTIRRKNIVTLNYTIVQLLRLEDEAAFRCYGRFFPQLSGSHQAERNNTRWRIMLNFLRANFNSFTNPTSGESFYFEWDYKPLETKDIFWYCVFFR